VDYGSEINFQIELNLKYAGYIQRQQVEVERFAHSESIKIPRDFDFAAVHGLRLEARQKLSQVNPENVGQAARIAGVSPADISVLMIALR
jgi:tRNA uridine 5-carboxymethylaminomethyl modification enzyme